MAGAAFFDLDRTLIARSSALALAGAFRRAGLIDRRHVAKAAAWQILFAARGLGAEATARAVVDGIAFLRGFRQAELRTLVAESMDSALKPLVYREAVELVAFHRARNERTFVVSAALQEIADALAAEIGIDGALGSLAEVEDGVYTGRCLRACHGAAKAAAVRELAEHDGVDLGASTAYADGASDLPLLAAVGRAVAVNPDRELRAMALERGWEIARFRTLLHPRPTGIRRLASRLRAA